MVIFVSLPQFFWQRLLGHFCWGTDVVLFFQYACLYRFIIYRFVGLGHSQTTTMYAYLQGRLHDLTSWGGLWGEIYNILICYKEERMENLGQKLIFSRFL